MVNSILLTFMASLSTMFTMMTHPLSMSLILLMETILVTMSTGLLNSSFWYSYIMFLIMVGGMLVLFIYMTSIASNEKFKWSKWATISLPKMMIISSMFMMFMSMNMTMEMKMEDSKSLMSFTTESMIKFINQPTNLMMYMIIIYLLITMIATAKITNKKSGALRQKK